MSSAKGVIGFRIVDTWAVRTAGVGEFGPLTAVVSADGRVRACSTSSPSAATLPRTAAFDHQHHYPSWHSRYPSGAFRRLRRFRTHPSNGNSCVASTCAAHSASDNFPPLTGPSRTFIFDRELSYRVRDFTRNSRFVLYDNGAFELQYPPSQYGPGLYRGAYRNANAVLTFLFDSSTGRRVDEPWDDATGTLEGDSLTIQYKENMQHSDFENAAYVLAP